MERQVPDVFDVFALGQGGDTFLPSSIIWRTIIKTAQKHIWIIQSTVHKGGEGRREIGGCPAAPWETRMWEQVAVIFPPIMIIVTDYDGCHDYED